MRKQSFILASTAVLSLASINVYADEYGFKGAGEFGFTQNTGNTVSKSMLGALKLDYLQQAYEVRSAFSVDNRSEEKVTTQERYVADMQYNRFFSDDRSFYGFTQMRFEKDEFADLDLDSLFTVGLGKTLIKDDKMMFKTEAGVGYQHTDYIVDDNVKQVVARLKADFTYQINQQVAFLQDAIVYTGKDQTKLETNTGVKVRMASNLNLKAGFQFRTNTDPAPGIKKNDTQTTLTIIYDF